jgi:transcriptional regulator with XRE-family HTH domain
MHPKMQPIIVFLRILMYDNHMIEDEKTAAKKGKATELSQDIAGILVALREDRQMSQRDFADRIGVSFQQYQKYEKGKDRLSLERAMMLCKHLGLSLNIFAEEISFGFAESEQSGFASSKHTAEEQELLDLFARVPKKNKENFLAAVRQLIKMV